MTETDGDEISPPTLPLPEPVASEAATDGSPDSKEQDAEVDSGTEDEDEKHPASLTRTVAEWVVVLGGALLVAVLIRQFVFTTFWIPSASMEPTLIGDSNSNGRHDRVVINRLSYKLHAVHRGDIIVFKTPPSEGDITENGHQIKDLIKRVIGLPGETVSLQGGHVYINGKLLDETYLPKNTPTLPLSGPGCNLQSVFKVPAHDVLVMGDNRTDSTDGRCFGPIKESSILGRAFVRIWPLNKIRWL